MANELYRQCIHLCVGLAAVLSAAVLSQQAFLVLWGVLTLLYIAATFIFFRELKFIFNTLERSDVVFRGKGGLFYFLGILATGALFYPHAVLALLLLAIPDALATMLAPLIRSPPLPYNHRKSVWGSTVFFVSASVILSLWVQHIAIFFIALLLTAIESFDYREIPFLDDNIVIPVVAGFLLQFL